MGTLRYSISLSEVFHQHPVDEDVTAPNLLQKNALTGVVKEAGIVPRDATTTPEEKT